MKDELYLLRPGFRQGTLGPFYCGDSVAVEGMLSFFPDLRDVVSVHYIDAPRPRAEIVRRIGEDNQSVPVLILADATTATDRNIAVRSHNGTNFIDAPDDIRRYLSCRYGVAVAA